MFFIPFKVFLLGKEWVGAHLFVLRIAAPIILANLSIPLLGAVDTAVIGHLPHAYYLGSVAIGSTIIQFIYWGFGFLRMGTSGLTAQAHGAKKTDEGNLHFLRAAIIALLIGLILWLIQNVIINVALIFFDTTETIKDLVRIYYKIRIWSAPAVLINYCLIGWFIGIQNTRVTLIIQIWMNILNIILDLFFVVGLDWGIEGVAWATVIAETSALLLGLYFYHKEIAKQNIKNIFSKIIEIDKLRRMMAINFDIFIRTFCLIFAFSYFTAETAKFGEIVLAANAVLLQFIHFLSFGLDGFAHAAETLVGDALGAKDRKKFKTYVAITTVWAVVISFIYSGAYWVFSPLIIDLLTDIPSVRIIANQMTIWVICLPIIAVWPYMLDGIFIGATRSAEMRNGMIFSLIVFIVAIFIFKQLFGFQGLWLALLVFMAARGITLAYSFPKIGNNLKIITVTNTD